MACFCSLCRAIPTICYALNLLVLLRAIVIKMTQAVSTLHRLNPVSGAGVKDPSDETPFGGSNRSSYSSK